MIVRTLVEDRQGALWIGAGSGLYRRWPDGRTERYTTEHGLPANDVLALLMDADGQLWVGTRKVYPRSRWMREPTNPGSSGVTHKRMDFPIRIRERYFNRLRGSYGSA